MVSNRKVVNPLTLGERIKKARKELDLTQQGFADRIGMKRNSIAQVEMGRNTSDQTIVSICREFNINEEWLRSGKGEMFVQQSEDDELVATVERLITGESAEFKRRLVCALSTLKDEHWLLLEQKLKEIVGMRDAAPAFAPAPDMLIRVEKPPQEMSDAELHAELDRQLAEEKKQAESPSAYGRGKSGTVAG